jgi:hypothetical protein
MAAPRKPRAARARKPSPSEFQIETVILTYLNLLPDTFAFKVETSGYWNAKRGHFQRRKSPHYWTGTADIVGVTRGQFFAIEVKRQSGAKRAEDQKAFLARVVKAGGLGGFATSVEEALALLGLPPELALPAWVRRRDGTEGRPGAAIDRGAVHAPFRDGIPARAVGWGERGGDAGAAKLLGGDARAGAAVVGDGEPAGRAVPERLDDQPLDPERVPGLPPELRGDGAGETER